MVRISISVIFTAIIVCIHFNSYLLVVGRRVAKRLSSGIISNVRIIRRNVREVFGSDGEMG